MADPRAVEHEAEELAALRVVALAPNLRGAQDAAAAGAHSVIVPVSASEAHSRSNVRRARADQVAEVARVVAWARTLGPNAPRIEGGIATAFGCSLQGVVAEDDVVALAAALVGAGADVIGLADTLGYASPRRVRRLVRAVRAEVTLVGGGPVIKWSAAAAPMAKAGPVTLTEPLPKVALATQVSAGRTKSADRPLKVAMPPLAVLGVVP